MVAPTRFKQLQIGDRADSAQGQVQAFGGAVVSQANTLAYTDAGVAKNLFVIPANSQILEIYVDVITAFNSSGTDLVDVGVSGTSDLFASALDVSSQARKLGSSSASKLTNYVNTGATQITVQATYSQSVADSTAGSARITIKYIPGNNLV